jgi:hypothetical protein
MKQCLLLLWLFRLPHSFTFFWFLSFYHYIYSCEFCILLYNSVSNVFLLLCLCIIVMYALFCTFCIHCASCYSSATLTGFSVLFSVVRQIPGYKWQRRDTARTLPNYWIVLICVLFVFKCVMYCTVLCCTVLYCTVLYCTAATGVKTIEVNKYININILVRSTDPVHCCSSAVAVWCWL